MPQSLTFFMPSFATKFELPLLAYRIAAGFPSPADDYQENRIDLNELLIQNPPATFVARVTGDSMKDAGIFDGDYVVVNQAAEWADGSIVIAVIRQEFTLKRIKRIHSRVFLMPENPSFQPIEVNEDSDCEIWGCVMFGRKLTEFEPVKEALVAYVPRAGEKRRRDRVVGQESDFASAHTPKSRFKSCCQEIVNPR